MKRLVPDKVQEIVDRNLSTTELENGAILLFDGRDGEQRLVDPTFHIPHQGKSEYSTKRKGRKAYWERKR